MSTGWDYYESIYDQMRRSSVFTFMTEPSKASVEMMSKITEGLAKINKTPKFSMQTLDIPDEDGEDEEQ